MERLDPYRAAELMSPRRTHQTQKLRRLLPAALAAVFLLAPGLSQGEALQDFEAVYRIEKYDTDIGIATYLLKQVPGQAHFSMRSKPTGFVALFRNDRVAEDSWLEEKNGALQLQRYSYQQTGGKQDRKTELAITWLDNDTIGNARGQHDGQPVNIKVSTRVRDALSFQLTLMQYAASHSNLNFDVLNKDELKIYAFKRVGKEILEIDQQNVETTIVERQQDDRTTRLWLADKYQYVPIKIIQTQENKSETRMLINSLSLSGKQVL